MADATDTVMTERSGEFPHKGTYEVAANVLLVGGSIITRDSAGRADVPTDGQDAIGISLCDADNRTSAPEGGAAGAISVDVHYGVFGFLYSGTEPIPGCTLFVVDNQTVSVDSDSGSRGIAGMCAEVVKGVAYVHMGLGISRMLRHVTFGSIVVPVSRFRTAGGLTLPAFASGTVDGVVVSEGLMFRWNTASTGAIWADIPMPDDVDGAAPIVLHALCSREGSADVTTTLTVAAYIVAAGDAYTADADCGGSTDAISAATTVVQDVSRVLAAADVPVSPAVLSFSLVPSAALDADKLNLHGVVITYERTV
jgi:hypothetical protein